MADPPRTAHPPSRRPAQMPRPRPPTGTLRPYAGCRAPAGGYGIPLVVPPAVAILGAGKVREDAVVVGGAVRAHRRMPLSLSFDHRCITGGEACRFLGAVITDLEKPD